MKRFKYLMVVALCALSIPSFGQKAGEWGSVYIQYNPMTLVQDFSNSEDLDFTGFTLGYDKNISIAGTTPLYIQVGGAVNAAFYSDSNDEIDESVTFVAVKVPVSIAYKWQASNSVAVVPYAGIYARLNILGSWKVENDYDDETLNLFDKKDMGSNDATWGRFQLGYQIGANVMFNNTWHVGLAWSSDFSEICKKTKFNTPAITIGFDF